MKAAILILFAFAIFAGYFSFNSKSPESLLENTSSNSSSGETVPFEELTVPYLRSREYKSSLGELELFSKSLNYTSYLTSYDSDGLKINGLLTRPDGEAPEGGWPAIVFIHGYIAPDAYQTTEKYGDYVDYLARNGLVVFKIDLRGHGNSEGEPGGAYYSSDYVIDALSAYSALQSSGFVNPSRVGMWGHSMAGNVVLRSLAVWPDIPAVVIWAGAGYSYSDLRELGLNDNSYRPPSTNTDRQRRRRELFEKYGEFSNESDFWKKVAPTNFASEFDGAVQLHHAVDDDVVDIEYSRRLMAVLDKTSVVHQLFEYQSGGHNISGSSFNLAISRTAEFFLANL